MARFSKGLYSTDLQWSYVSDITDHNFDSNPLSLSFGSPRFFVRLYTAEEELISGGIDVRLTPEGQYSLEGCSGDWVDFSASFQEVAGAEWWYWRIFIDMMDGADMGVTNVRVRINCNEVEVLNILLNAANCFVLDWEEIWMLPKKKYKLYIFDGGNDIYICL